VLGAPLDAARRALTAAAEGASSALGFEP